MKYSKLKHESFKILLSWYAYSESDFLRTIACAVIEAIQREGKDTSDID